MTEQPEGTREDELLEKAEKLGREVTEWLSTLKRECGRPDPVERPPSIPALAVRRDAGGTGARFRYREFRLVPDREPDAEPTATAAQCCVCEQQSAFAEDPELAASWALDHLHRSREHFTYRVLTRRAVRAEPGEWL